RKRAMDQGIWATWCDLADVSRERYLKWVHECYCPYLRVQPGYSWVAHYRYTGGGAQMERVKQTAIGYTQEAIGSGNQYLLLVGAASAHTFFKPSLDEITLPPEYDEMLALRVGLRTAIFTEEARVNGPEPREFGPGSGPGLAIQMGSFRMRTPEEEFDLGRWYAQYRLPFMARMPGCIATRKLCGVAGWAKHSVLYEFTSLETRLHNFEEPHEALALDSTRWESKVMAGTVHTPGSPFIGERIWPP
ncbi:MAG: hypothetical protein ABL891_15640, partial [Burkholderiales bacterium]